ncbi:hypothetical protein ACUODF_13675, partial [Escherichia coli]
EVLESHIRETFDRNDCYSREVSQSVGVWHGIRHHPPATVPEHQSALEYDELE